MFRPEDFAELTTPAAPNRKGNIFFVARPPLLCEEGNAPLLQFRACRAASPGSSTAPGLAAQHLPEAARLPDLLRSISRKQHGSRTCCAAAHRQLHGPGVMEVGVYLQRREPECAKILTILPGSVSSASGFPSISIQQ